MKKIILVLPVLSILLLAFVLPASASKLNNATNKTCYENTSEQLLWANSGLPTWCFRYNGEFLGNTPNTSLINYVNQLNVTSVSLCGDAFNFPYGIIQSANIDTLCQDGPIPTTYEDCLSRLASEDYFSNIIEVGSCPTPEPELTTPILTATSSLTTIMTSAINSVVGLALEVFNYWWPFVLVIGIIVALVGVFSRFALIGIRKAGRKK